MQKIIGMLPEDLTCKKSGFVGQLVRLIVGIEIYNKKKSKMAIKSSKIKCSQIKKDLFGHYHEFPNCKKSAPLKSAPLA